MKEKGFVPLVVLFIAAIVSATAIYMNKDTSHTTTHTAIPMESIGPSSSEADSSSSSAVSQDTITASGSYEVSGEKISYNFSFPKGGGPVTGYVSGICTGQISGKFDGGEDGNINGEIKGTCGIGFLQKDVLLTYQGTVHEKEGNAQIDWQGDAPIGPQSGSFTLTFNN